MSRVLTAATAAALSLLLSGCRFEADLDVAADGSGTGSMVLVDPPPGLTVQDMSRQLGRAGFTTGPIETPAPNRYRCHVAWSEFDHALGRRIVNADHSVTLDFGPLDQGTLVVHVPGRIDAGDTSGAVDGRSTATFARGRARVTYAPGGAAPFAALAAGSALLIAVVVMAAWLLHRQRSRAASPTHLPDRAGAR